MVSRKMIFSGRVVVMGNGNKIRWGRVVVMASRKMIRSVGAEHNYVQYWDPTIFMTGTEDIYDW